MKRIIAVLISAIMFCSGMADVPVFAEETAQIRVPINFVTASRNKVIGVSWKNPAADDIASISLYDISGETAKLVADSAGNAKECSYIVEFVAPKGAAQLTTAAGARNCLDLRDLTNNQKYKYRLDIVYSSGEKYTGEIVPRPPFDTGKDAPVILGADGDTKISNWAVSVGGYPHFQFRLVRGGYDDSSAALHIAGNIDGAISNTYQRLIPLLNEGESIERSKTYEFSYYVKGSGSYNIGIKRYRATGDSNVTVENYKSADTVNSDEWIKKSFMYGANAPANPCELQIQPYFMIDRTIEELYIDNVELREVGSDGTLGENLIANGDFEQQSDLQTVEVSSASAASTKGITTIRWDALDTSKADAVMIYKSDENKSYSDTVRAAYSSETSISFESDGAEEYIIKTINKCGVESEGVAVSCLHTDEFECSVLQYMAERTAEGKLAPGTINFSRKVINNKKGNNFEVMMLAAVYDGNLLKDYAVACTTLAQNGSSDTLSVDVTIDSDNENPFIKVFMWKNSSDFRSLYDAEIVE